MFLCLLFLMLSRRLFIAALWSPAWKGLTSWLLLVMFIVFFFFVTFHVVSLVWYLIVSYLIFAIFLTFKISMEPDQTAPYGGFKITTAHDKIVNF